MEYLPPNTTLNEASYAQTLRRLKDCIRRERPQHEDAIFILHDNSPVHKSEVANDALKKCGFRELSHPPYSPDLAPSHYCVFSNLKKCMRGKRYSSDNELISTCNQFFESKDFSFFFSGIGALWHRYDKCIRLEGGYVEKE
jgi:histone-lysine N-methyltransferase SETMAR